MPVLWQVYGYQGVKSGTQSEQILGRLAKASSSPVVVGTKFFTVPWTNFLIGGGFRCQADLCCGFWHVLAGAFQHEALSAWTAGSAGSP